MLSQTEINRVFRILDANKNRAVEGLRAVEEFFRFVVSNEMITQKLKEFRHSLCAACRDHADAWLLQRDSDEDVGGKIQGIAEYSRSGFDAIIAANLSRAGESLRVLEEYSKTFESSLGAAIEKLRYQFYDLEKEVKQFVLVQKKLAGRSLYVLTSACKDLMEFEYRINELCQSNVGVIQLREKNLADGELLARAKIATAICKTSQTLFIVNDRPDVAVLSGADGVHIGQDELPIKDVRLMVPASMIIGISTHSIEQARAAVENGADYIGVGPTFPSKTKCFSDFKGTELLKQVASEISIPAFAIGGINLDNVQQVIDAGLNRVAISNAIHSAESTSEAVAAFTRVLENEK